MPDKNIIAMLDQIDPLITQLRSLYDEKRTDYEDNEEIDTDVSDELDEFESALDGVEGSLEEIRELYKEEAK